MRSLCRPLQVARLAAYGDVKPASALRSTVTMWTCDSIHNSVNCESIATRHSALATSPSLSTPSDSNQSLIESRTGSPNQLYVVVPKPILEDKALATEPSDPDLGSTCRPNHNTLRPNLILIMVMPMRELSQSPAES